jgi:two-component system phosphate regulon sensor histidine kinase PhoR
LYVVLLPLIIAAAGVLSYYAWDTASRFEELGATSIAHSTLLLVEEKIDRIEQQIISRDNAVFHLVEVGEPDGLRTRWLPLAERVSPSVRAVLVLSDDLEVVDYAARATPEEQRVFLKLFKKRLASELSLADLAVGQLRHLHTTVNGTSYLLSYMSVLYEGSPFIVVAHHDTGYILREEFPRLFANEEARAYLNVVDDDGKRLFGDSLTKVADYLVGKRFPTTLYRWRLQLAPKDAPLLEQQARQREFNKAALIASSGLILVAAVVFFLYASLQERRLNALKSDFIANVSHELKTPLSVVRMFAELLMTQRVSSPQKQRQYLEMIGRESERLSALIENVLDFAALERGKQTYAREEADLGEIVQRGVETVRARLDNVELRVHVPESAPPVSVDPQAILLAVINLIDNAVKYGEGSAIDVSVEIARRELWVQVRDHGPGIPREETRRVFDRFYRVRRPGQQVRGSGIGLSLVKHIAEAHGGRAWADNAPDGGAVVSFSVARGRAERRAAPAADVRGAAREPSLEEPALNDPAEGVPSSRS